MAELRSLLRLTPADGFVLSSERPRRPLAARLFGSRRPEPRAVVLERGQLEAAARLGMWEEFDASQFDALCLRLQVRHSPRRQRISFLSIRES